MNYFDDFSTELLKYIAILGVLCLMLGYPIVAIYRLLTAKVEFLRELPNARIIAGEFVSYTRDHDIAHNISEYGDTYKYKYNIDSLIDTEITESRFTRRRWLLDKVNIPLPKSELAIIVFEKPIRIPNYGNGKHRDFPL